MRAVVFAALFVLACNGGSPADPCASTGSSLCATTGSGTTGLAAPASCNGN